MSEYVILADSACDLPTEIVDEFGIRIIPISYMLNDNEYPNLTDHSEYPIQKFYKEISEGAKVSTAAINPFELKEFMEVSLKAGKDVIYFAFSSALSCIYRNAHGLGHTGTTTRGATDGARGMVCGGLTIRHKGSFLADLAFGVAKVKSGFAETHSYHTLLH